MNANYNKNPYSIPDYIYLYIFVTSLFLIVIICFVNLNSSSNTPLELTALQYIVVKTLNYFLLNL